MRSVPLTGSVCCRAMNFVVVESQTHQINAVDGVGFNGYCTDDNLSGCWACLTPHLAPEV